MSLYIKKRKRYLRKLLVGLGLFGIGAAGFFLTRALLEIFLPNHAHIHPLSAVLMTTLLFVLAHKPLDVAITQLFRNYLFKKKSYGHISLMNLADDLSSVLNLNEFSNLVVNTFGEVLHLNNVALILQDRYSEDYRIASAWGWNLSESKKMRLAKSAPIMELVRKSGPHVLVRDRVVRVLSWQEANTLAYDFDRLRASWIIPLIAGEKQVIGLLAFSAANPDSVFDEADFQFFREFGAKVAKTSANVMRFDELQKANEELQDAQAELVQATKLSAIEQLATGIAHEIHNPLTIISGKAQVLLLQKDRTNVDGRVEDVLKTIVKQTKRAADITRKLLMFSQGSGSLKEPINLEQVLKDTIALISYQTSLEGIKIKPSVSQSMPMLYANVHEMREVFLNLILNAVQSIDGSGVVQVELTDHPQEQYIEILMADSGQGISEEHLDKLFNPFFTTRHEAVGLGLFVTRQIIHRYGGTIRVDSEKGQGTVFIIQLPYIGPTGMQMVEKGKEHSLESSKLNQ